MNKYEQLLKEESLKRNNLKLEFNVMQVQTLIKFILMK